jgi:hypothetical protein
MTILLAIVFVLMSALTAQAQSRWEQCLATKTCKAEVDKLLAAKEAEIRASLPCAVFADSKEEAAELVGKAGKFCVVIENVTPCDGNYCGMWSTP